MEKAIPVMDKVRKRLSTLNTAQLKALAKSSHIGLSTIDKIKTGRTPNPGIETVGSLMKHFPDARRVKGVSRKRKRKGASVTGAQTA